MRISDWSSDVCSSDLVNQMVPVGDHIVHRAAVVAIGYAAIHAAAGLRLERVVARLDHEFAVVLHPLGRIEIVAFAPRSEERRVGKEGVSTLRSRWSP